jgi:hypothetical protein
MKRDYGTSGTRTKVVDMQRGEGKGVEMSQGERFIVGCQKAAKGCVGGVGGVVLKILSAEIGRGKRGSRWGPKGAGNAGLRLLI